MWYTPNAIALKLCDSLKLYLEVEIKVYDKKGEVD